jgi:HD-GYP domain-containing protein (c-di-GMP phosphodiesterase class II)
MKQIAVESLKPGMAFTEPVYIDGDNVLVPENIPLRQKDIDQLKDWGVEVVETEGHIVGGQAAARKTSSLSLTEVQENKGPYRTYTSFIERLDGFFGKIANREPVEARLIDTISSQLLQELRERRNSFIDYILGGEISGHDLAKNSINTAILSALIAQELKLANHKILHITTGALLHDVGMLRLPKEILDKRGGLSDAELKQVKDHPLHGHKIANTEMSFPEEVSRVVLQHHERWDGAGYPHRTLGTRIDIGARIVSVADAFEAMVSQKSYRNSMVGYQAMKNLMADNSRRFDPNVLKYFIKIMGIYPIGSIVVLSNSAIARVIEVHGEAPLRPKIHLLINEYGKTFKPNEGDIIDLLTEKSLFITKAVDHRELAGKN